MTNAGHAYIEVMPFDDLDKESGPVLDWLREDLEEVAVLVEIDEDFQPADLEQ